MQGLKIEPLLPHDSVYLELGYSGAEHSEEQNGFDDLVEVRLVIGLNGFCQRVSGWSCQIRKSVPFRHVQRAFE